MRRPLPLSYESKMLAKSAVSGFRQYLAAARSSAAEPVEAVEVLEAVEPYWSPCGTPSSSTGRRQKYADAVRSHLATHGPSTIRELAEALGLGDHKTEVLRAAIRRYAGVESCGHRFSPGHGHRPEVIWTLKTTSTPTASTSTAASTASTANAVAATSTASYATSPASSSATGHPAGTPA